MRVFALMIAVTFSAPALAIDAQTALDMTEAVVTDTLGRVAAPSVACESTGHGSFRMRISTECAEEGTFSTYIETRAQTETFYITDFATYLAVGCPAEVNDVLEQFDSSQEFKNGKRKLAKYCRETLRAQ